MSPAKIAHAHLSNNITTTAAQHSMQSQKCLLMLLVEFNITKNYLLTANLTGLVYFYFYQFWKNFTIQCHLLMVFAQIPCFLGWLVLKFYQVI